MNDITMIIKGVVYVIFGVLMVFVIPYVKGKLNAHQMEILYTLVFNGVHAAEQLFNSDQGKEKFQYVLDYLRDKGYKVDDESLKLEFKTLIESAVRELRIEQGQLPKPAEKEAEPETPEEA